MNTTLQRKSKRNTQVLRRYRMRRFGAVALVAASLMVLSATAASADIDVDTDLVRIATVSGPVDFGSNTHTSTAATVSSPAKPGSPVGSGNVVFSMALSTITARVTGTVWYDDPFRRGCASVRVSFYNINGHRVDNRYSERVCGPVNGKAAGLAISFLMDDALRAPDTVKTNGYRLRVVSRVSYNDGLTWTEGAFTDAFLGGI